MRRILTIILVALAFPVWQVSAIVFATHRLQTIVNSLSLSRLDTLPEGTSNDYRYRNQRLTVRCNRYGEVEHVGLCLFSEEMRQLNPSPVYDFLERDLLERQLPALDGALKHKQENEHLTFVVGSERTPASFTGDEDFSEERIDLKGYRVMWSRDGRELLKISFDMDPELLLGADAIELEEWFLRRLARYEPSSLSLDLGLILSEGGDYKLEGDSFLIPEMRNDLYYERDGAKGWHLVASAAKPSKTLPNMMLSPAYPDTLSLQLTLDKYGYGTEQCTIPYRHLLEMTINEGCVPYFGLKGREEDGTYTGTLLLVNRRGGYVHMLSVAVPAVTLANPKYDAVLGRLYLYIPMYNVSDKYFNQS